jgi:tyrosyl-tRNA synthetase
LLQGYDFVLLNRLHGVSMQMGGSDQYGNITSGVELSRKIDDAKVYAITTPLLTKSDGSKFGKSESGNIWLDPKKTSPYKFYQFWLNADDRDLPKYLRYFSLKDQSEIEALEASQTAQELKRIFAAEITIRMHGQDAFESVMSVSKLLFDANADEKTLRSLDAGTLEQVAEEIPSPKVSKDVFVGAMNMLDFLSEITAILPSRSEAKRSVMANMIAINKIKITDLTAIISAEDLLYDRFIMVESGKKNKFIVEIV